MKKMFLLLCISLVSLASTAVADEKTPSPKKPVAIKTLPAMIDAKGQPIMATDGTIATSPETQPSVVIVDSPDETSAQSAEAKNALIQAKDKFRAAKKQEYQIAKALCEQHILASKPLLLQLEEKELLLSSLAPNPNATVDMISKLVKEIMDIRQMMDKAEVALKDKMQQAIGKNMPCDWSPCQ